LYETVTRLQIFRKLKWLDDSSFKPLYLEAEEISRMLSGLVHSLETSI